MYFVLKSENLKDPESVYKDHREELYDSLYLD